MKYQLEKGSSKMMISLLTGIFIMLMFSYQLYELLQIDEFVAEFPGDWDKIIGILVGAFLSIRSVKFRKEAKELFIKITGNELSYRTKRSYSMHTIPFSTIEKIQKKENKILLTTKDNKELMIVDFNKLPVKGSLQESIKQSLVNLNDKLNK